MARRRTSQAGVCEKVRAGHLTVARGELIIQGIPVSDVIGSVGEHFNIDLTPLERVFAPNHDGSETAWEATAQPPGELADCLRNLAQVLTDDPSAFAGMELAPSESYLTPEQLQRNRDYFLKGEFLRDLTDLLRMAEWAEESGEERVRLYYG